MSALEWAFIEFYIKISYNSCSVCLKFQQARIMMTLTRSSFQRASINLNLLAEIVAFSFFLMQYFGLYVCIKTAFSSLLKTDFDKDSLSKELS